MGQCSVDPSKTTLGASDIYRGNTKLKPGQQGFCSACESAAVWWMRTARTHARTNNRTFRGGAASVVQQLGVAGRDRPHGRLHPNSSSRLLDRSHRWGRPQHDRKGCAHIPLSLFSDPLGVGDAAAAAPKEAGPLCARRRKGSALVSDLDRFVPPAPAFLVGDAGWGRPTGPKTHNPGPYRSTSIEETRSGGRCFDRTRPSEAPSIESDDDDRDRARPRREADRLPTCRQDSPLMRSYT